MGPNITLVEKLFTYLKKHRPDSVNKIDKSLLDYLSHMGGNKWSGRVLIVVCDVNRNEIIHTEGHEHLGYSADQFTYKKSLEIVPMAYGALHEAQIEGFHNLYNFQFLKPQGVLLHVDKPIVVQHASRRMFRAQHEHRIVICDEHSIPVIVIHKYIILEEWTIYHPPVPMVPEVFLMTEKMPELEAELFNLSMPLFLETTLKLNAIQIRIMKLMLEKDLTNGQIGVELNKPKTTVNWHCTRVIEQCQEHFSKRFTMAVDWAIFLRMIHVL
ncbi:MAG: hypothetical protein R3A50_00780 [Saprospiraceae bacterium]